MSPPCQPYTQGGLKKDHEDTRAKALLHLIEALNLLSDQYRPHYIFVENVPGFEVSQSRAHFIETLHTIGFNVEEYILSPIYIGIPNDRKRYYLLARRKRPDEIDGIVIRSNKESHRLMSPIKTFLNDLKPVESVPTLRDFLYQADPPCNDNLQDYYVPEKFLLKPIRFRFGKIRKYR